MKDRTCLACFIIFLLVWIIIGSVLIANGNPPSLIYGTDYQGNTCGSSNVGLKINGQVANNGNGGRDQSANPKITYPRLTHDVIESEIRSGFDPKNAVATISKLGMTGVCVPKCPNQGDWVCLYEGEDALTNILKSTGMMNIEPYRTNQINRCRDTTTGTGDCNTVTTNCYQTLLNTTSSFHRCIPMTSVKKVAKRVCTNPGPLPDDKMDGCIIATITEVSVTTQPAQSAYVYDKLNTDSAIATKNYGDLKKTAVPVGLVGILFSMAVSFVFVVLLGCSAWCTVWSIIVLLIVSMACITIALYYKGGVVSTSWITSSLVLIGQNSTATQFQLPAFLANDVRSTGYYIVAGNLCLFIAIILLIIVIELRSRITVAIDIIQECSRCIKKMPMVLLYPFLTNLLLFLVFLWTGAVAFNLASSTDLAMLNGRVNFTASAAEQKLLGMIEKPLGNSTGAINKVGSSILTVAGSASIYTWLAIYHVIGFLWTSAFVQSLGMATVSGAVSTYYFIRNKEDMPANALSASFKRACKFNLGSIAFGSFLLSLFEIFRLFLEAINRKIHSIQVDNRLGACVVKMIRCCVYLVDVCLKFVSRNAIIVMAMCGTGFFTSAMEATNLIFHNSTQVATVNVIGELVLLLGKLLVCISGCSILFFSLDGNPAYGPL